ncbi:hypothetical protein K438DRAFT_1975608 [Mycena galopus ATCC 62051]|nr:hypothetical protein K438DRAFT_1975608 [Mycena galopus ATCC 62051]
MLLKWIDFSSCLAEAVATPSISGDRAFPPHVLRLSNWLNAQASGGRGHATRRARAVFAAARDLHSVLALMQKGRHWVLVSLLGKVLTNESLPIFLDTAIGGGSAAVVLSTTAIGESQQLRQRTANAHRLSLT